MKKLRLTLPPGSLAKKFHLFPNVESLYVWSTALEQGDTVQVNDLQEVLLEGDDFLEVETVGYEYSYERSNVRRFDLIRLGRGQRTQNSSGLLITVHTGWVSGGTFPLKDGNAHGVDVKRIGNVESLIDLAALCEAGTINPDGSGP